MAWGQPVPNGKNPPLTRILFIFDASQSMYGRWQSDTKINIARQLMINLLDSIKTISNLELALRVYGHQRNYPPKDCSDTKLEIPFAPNNINRIKTKIKSIVPRGSTPITQSLIAAAHDFPPCDSCRNIIILITDGIEECEGDPCEASLFLQRKGLVLKPFVIGIGRDFRAAFDCVGTYYDASSEHAFSSALNAVISQVLNPTTLQIDLLDPSGKPTETNVNMTFFSRINGLPRYNFIHTLNRKGLPDTLTIDPLMIYDLVVHTTPPLRLDSLVLEPGEHNKVSLPAAQGGILLVVKGNERLLHNAPVMVRRTNQHEILNTQGIGENKRYLAGRYDLDVLSLPRLTISGVEVHYQHTTTVEIPLPGIVVINKSVYGHGSLYVVHEDRPVWIYDLRDGMLQETLTLMPGNYRIYFRSKSVDRSFYTVEKEFSVVSGQTLNVKVF